MSAISAPASGPSEPSAIGKLIVLMVTAFFDMVGALMIIPLIPFFAKQYGANGFVVGLLVSSFAIAQLISSPMWGRFSDRYGRRPALLVGLGASAIAYLIFAFAHSLWLLFLMRIVQGAGGGTVSVIQAYVADATKPEDRAKSLGWMSAATNAGVSLGPVLGSLSMSLGGSGPGLVAAAICTLNMAFAWRFLRESRDMAEAKSSPRVKGRSREAVIHVITHSGQPASRLILIYAFGMAAFMGTNSMLALFLNQRFGVTAATIGYFYVYIGLISFVTRAFLLGWAVKRFGEARLTRLGASLLAIGLAVLPFTHRLANPDAVAASLGGMVPAGLVALLPFLTLGVAVALIPLGTAFTFPCVTALLSRVVPSHERGLYMGVQQTFGGIARVAFPIFAGFLFDRVVELPFLVAAALAATTIALGAGMERYLNPVVPAPASSA